jgi:hypothetical protein
MKQGINIKKASKELKAAFKQFGIVSKIDENDTNLSCTFSIKIKPYDDNIIGRFDYAANGTAHFLFTFDHLTPNEQSLRLINNLNENNDCFVAYIDAKKQLLRLSHSVQIIHQEDVGAYAATILSCLASETLVPYLVPLTKLTTAMHG